jgi:hypothetical protein
MRPSVRLADSPAVSLIPHGDEGKFLAAFRWLCCRPLPNCSKPWSAGAYDASTKWRRCPPLGIAERLGTEGLRLRELARGEGDRKLLALAGGNPFRR